MTDSLSSPMLEREVIATFMSQTEGMEDGFFMAGLSEDDFYTAENKIIFGVIRDIATNNIESLNLYNVVERLREKKYLNNEVDSRYVLGLGGLQCQSCTSKAQLMDASRKLRELNLRRKIVDLSPVVAEYAADRERSLPAILEELQRKVLSLMEQGDTGDKRMSDYVAEYRERMQRIESGDISPIPTGFLDLDKKLSGGLESRKQFVIVAARSAMGKTAFALQMAVNMAKQGKRVYFVSLEQPVAKLMDRIVSAEILEDSTKLRQRETLPAIREKCDAALTVIEQMPLVFDDRSGLTVADISARAMKLQSNGGLDCVFVDYLQLIQAREGLPASTPREQVIAGIADDLVSLSKRLNIPVVVLAQTNRAAESRQDKRPMLSDIRESDRIAQNADLVLALHREEYYLKDDTPEDMRNIAEVLILKNKEGESGRVYLMFIPQFVSFGNLAFSDSRSIVGRVLRGREAKAADAMASPDPEPKKPKEQELF